MASSTQIHLFYSFVSGFLTTHHLSVSFLSASILVLNALLLRLHKRNVAVVEDSIVRLLRGASIWLLLRSLSCRPLSVLLTGVILASPHWLPFWNRAYIYMSTLSEMPYRGEFDLLGSYVNNRSREHDVSTEQAHQRVRQHTEVELAKLRRFIASNKEEVQDRFASSPSRVLIDRFADGDYSGIPYRAPPPPSITSPSQLETGSGEIESESRTGSSVFEFLSVTTWLSVGIVLFAVYVIYGIPIDEVQ